MNLNTLVVVADSARARLFRLKPTPDHPRSAVELEEVDNLVHPEVRLKEGERYSGSFPGGARTGAAGQSSPGPAHTLDDHRGAHDAEDRRRFARQVAHSISERAKEHQHNPVLLVGTHAVYSILREELERSLPQSVYLRGEVGEFTELTPHRLLTQLQERQLFAP